MLTVQCSELAIKKYSKVSYEIRRMDYQLWSISIYNDLDYTAINNH